MKIRLLLLTFTVFSFYGVYAQTPGIPYQAVLLDKDASGVELPGMDDNSSYLMSNTLVSLRFSIHDADGKEFEEIHQSVMVDQYGMINVVVGRGTPTFNYFDDMDWNGEEKWLDVDIDFDNGSNFENLDYLPLHRLPSPGAQTISLLGDSIILSGGSGISLTQLLANAGTDDQQLSLVGTVLYLQDGGSIDLTQLATDTTFSNTLINNNPTFVTTLAQDSIFSTSLATDSTFVNALTSDSLFIANLDSLEDNQNLTSFTLSGTELEVDIEDGDSVKVDLIDLATDSSFVNAITGDSLFINNLVNDSILSQTFDTDRQEILILANNAQNQFNTPQQIDDINKIDVYRNGVKVGFTMFNVNTIQVEAGAVCYQGDEIRIVQFF